MMKDDSQTQPGAGISKPDLLNPKSKPKGDEGERVELGRGGKTSEGQATMAFTGNSLMWAYTHEED